MHTRKLIRVFQPPRVLQGRKGSICTAVLHTFMQGFFVSLFSFQCTSVNTFWTDGTFVFITFFKCPVLPLRTHSFVKFFVIRFTPLTFFMLSYCVLVVNTFLIFFFFVVISHGLLCHILLTGIILPLHVLNVNTFF